MGTCVQRQRSLTSKAIGETETLGRSGPERGEGGGQITSADSFFFGEESWIWSNPLFFFVRFLSFFYLCFCGKCLRVYLRGSINLASGLGSFRVFEGSGFVHLLFYLFVRIGFGRTVAVREGVLWEGGGPRALSASVLQRRSAPSPPQEKTLVGMSLSRVERSSFLSLQHHCQTTPW